MTTATIEVFGDFGGTFQGPQAWRPLRSDLEFKAAIKMCDGLTRHHYRAARVRHDGRIVHQSGAEIMRA